VIEEKILFEAAHLQGGIEKIFNDLAKGDLPLDQIEDGEGQDRGNGRDEEYKIKTVGDFLVNAKLRHDHPFADREVFAFLGGNGERFTSAFLLRPHHTPKFRQSPEVAFSNAMHFIVTLF
jgi:hypothetical protein